MLLALRSWRLPAARRALAAGASSLSAAAAPFSSAAAAAAASALIAARPPPARRGRAAATNLLLALQDDGVLRQSQSGSGQTDEAEWKCGDVVMRARRTHQVAPRGGAKLTLVKQ